jgi:hypothetical protein
MRPTSQAFLPVLLLALVAIPACSGQSKPGSPVRDRNVITHEQMQEGHFRNVYDAVVALHSNWLLTKGTDSHVAPGQVLVYFDNTRYGGVESLRGIATTSISYVRYYDAVAATARWGLDHGHGVIFVSTLEP